MKTFLIVAIAAIMLSCKTQNLLVGQSNHVGLDSVFAFNNKYQHVIRKDDKVEISVWGQEELSVGSVYGIYNSNEVYGKWLLVDIRGNVELPKHGSFHIEGYNLPALKDTLRSIYSKWIVNPVVDVKVLNKQITVMGEVKSPAMIQVDKDRNTLLDIISRTGGFDVYANLRSIKVLRQAGKDVHVATINLTKAENYLEQNIQVHPGDIIIVPSRKYKNFDRRISTIIPFTSTVTAAAILMSTL